MTPQGTVHLLLLVSRENMAQGHIPLVLFIYPFRMT